MRVTREIKLPPALVPRQGLRFLAPLLFLCAIHGPHSLRRPLAVSAPNLVDVLKTPYLRRQLSHAALLFASTCPATWADTLNAAKRDVQQHEQQSEHQDEQEEEQPPPRRTFARRALDPSGLWLSLQVPCRLNSRKYSEGENQGHSAHAEREKRQGGVREDGALLW